MLKWLQHISLHSDSSKLCSACLIIIIINIHFRSLCPTILYLLLPTLTNDIVWFKNNGLVNSERNRYRYVKAHFWSQNSIILMARDLFDENVVEYLTGLVSMHRVWHERSEVIFRPCVWQLSSGYLKYIYRGADNHTR